jgi:hypothetical protein
MLGKIAALPGALMTVSCSKGKFYSLASRFCCMVFSNWAMKENLGVPIPTVICRCSNLKRGSPNFTKKPEVVRYASILRGLESRSVVSGAHDFTLTATVSWLRNARLAASGPDMQLHVSSRKRYSAIPDGVTDITSLRDWVEQERFFFPVKGVSNFGVLYGVSLCISDPAAQMPNQIQMNMSIAEIVVGCLILFQKFRNSGLPAGRMTKFYRMHDPESQFVKSSNVVLRVSLCDHPEWQQQCEGSGSGQSS